jgi:hypothetical protein
MSFCSQPMEQVSHVTTVQVIHGPPRTAPKSPWMDISWISIHGPAGRTLDHGPIRNTTFNNTSRIPMTSKQYIWNLPPFDIIIMLSVSLNFAGFTSLTSHTSFGRLLQTIQNILANSEYESFPLLQILSVVSKHSQCRMLFIQKLVQVCT